MPASFNDNFLNGSTYSPLADSDEIRLLCLQPRCLGETISCAIKHVRLSDRPQYEALSYMWGSQAVKTIELDGESYEVRENLANALGNLRHETKERVLWIDALCINQKDTNERNHQVSQMGQLYRQASNVIAWLGEADESSAKLFEFIQDKETLQDRIDSDLAVVNESAIEGVSDCDLTEQGCEILNALSSLAQREYWRRLWIVQEIILASEVHVQCGSHSLPLVDLNRIRHKISSCWMAPLVHIVVLRSIMGRLIEENRGKHFVKSLESLIYKYGEGRCENMIDKVFGLHGMAAVCCREAVPIDYDLTLDQVLDNIVAHHRKCQMEVFRDGLTDIDYLRATFK